MILLVLAVLLTLSGDVFAESPTSEFWVDWPTISVPQESPPSESILLEARWKIDCGANAEELIGQIVSAAPGSRGRTLLLDQQMVHVLVVSPEGQIERVFGQSGEGPGDLPGAYRLFELLDGRIGVSGGAPALSIQMGGAGKIVLIDPAEHPAGMWHGGGDPGTMPVCSIRELRCSSDHILTASNGMMVKETGVTRIQELSTIDPSSGERQVVASRGFALDLGDSQIDERDWFEPYAHGRCDISNTGRVAFAPFRDRWLVVIRNSDGTGLVLDRQWNQIERSKEQKEAILKALGGAETCVALDNEPAVGRIRWRPNGELWVEPLGITPGEGAIACFDEFSPTGSLLRRVRIAVPNAEDGDDLRVMEDGRFVLLRGFGDNAEGEELMALESEVALLVERQENDSN